MSSGLENTSWPEIPISDVGKALIAKFFSMVDKPDPKSGRELAEEVFTDDGILIAGPNESKGHEAISVCREHAWDVISGRRHEIAKVYASDKAGLDVLMIGNLVATIRSGKAVTVSFTARIIMAETAKGLRIKKYEAWSDQTAIKALIQNS